MRRGRRDAQSASSDSSTGRAVFTIRWPAPSRLIPDASNSILVVVTQNATLIGRKLLPRPSAGGTTTATFDALPVGNLNLAATAFPSADGSGVAQATATIPLVIAANQTTNFSLTMNSTIDHLELTSPRESDPDRRYCPAYRYGKGRDGSRGLALCSQASMVFVEHDRRIRGQLRQGDRTRRGQLRY